MTYADIAKMWVDHCKTSAAKEDKHRWLEQPPNEFMDLLHPDGLIRLSYGYLLFRSTGKFGKHSVDEKIKVNAQQYNFLANTFMDIKIPKEPEDKYASVRNWIESAKK